MPEHFPADSVGLVTPRRYHFDQTIDLACGRSLSEFDLMYEMYGELNTNRDNAVLVCHALSGDQHAAGYLALDDKKPGWWETCIGPGKPIDTDHFCVIAIGNLGSCKGSTGPNCINPTTGKQYGPDFPIITVKDWVKSHAMLADALGIQQWAAVIGGSLGGMQAMQWAIDYPDRVRHAIVIASAPRLSAQNIAFNEVARQAILSDPEFHDGRYYDFGVVPRRGLMLARMLGHITYLSDHAMRSKFGRDLRHDRFNFDFNVEFEVESYLRYQGRSFVDRFDANTYLLMTKALDYFDPGNEYGDDLATAFRQAQAKFFVVSFTSDWRFDTARSREIVKSLTDADRDVAYVEIEAHHGHDAFLFPIPDYMNAFKAYMHNISLRG